LFCGQCTHCRTAYSTLRRSVVKQNRYGLPTAVAIESCTILTTAANELMRPIHDRMPVILDTEAESVWLDANAPVEDLRSLLVPFASEKMEAYPVDPYVNNAKNQGPKCVEPLEAA
jgi:putative SOS response-associated peptidase YedK